MITIGFAKSLAHDLSRQLGCTHSQGLEAVAHASGYRDWNSFVAAAAAVPDHVGRQRVIPILRMFDLARAQEFYCDLLGFRWVWRHQHEPDLPVYAEVERAGSVLHLSEHHGDATPGSGVMLVVDDLVAYQAHLLSRQSRWVRPGLTEQPWGTTMTVTDPFGNRLTFWQRSRQ